MNPFLQALQTLKAPADCGPSLSISGVNVELDAHGMVDVPAEVASKLRDGHGFRDATASEIAARDENPSGEAGSEEQGGEGTSLSGHAETATTRRRGR